MNSLACPQTTHTNSQQGDLGHTDLQEDLEFHSSSTLPTSLFPAPRSDCLPQISKTRPQRAPRSSQTQTPRASSPRPPPPPPRANTTSGHSPSTRKRSMSIPLKSYVVAPRPCTRAQTSSTSSRATPTSTAPCGSRPPSWSSSSSRGR